MNAGHEPIDDRRDPNEHVQMHVGQVWAAPIADADPVGLFHLGAACLDVAETAEDAARGALLASVASSLLLQAGGEDEAVAARIVGICARERTLTQRRPETARVLADLEKRFRDA
jgi:hypothetical protein